VAVIATAEVRVIADTSRFLTDLRRKLRGAFAQMGNRAGRQFNQQFNRQVGQRINQQFRQSLNQTVRTSRDAGRDSGRSFAKSFRRALTRGLRGLRPQFDIDWNASAIALAAGAIGAASGALLGIPAAVGLATGAIATFLVAFRGVGTALAAAGGDAAEFEEAVSGLAPAAAAVAREFRSFRDNLTDLRIDVQQALFAELDGVITDVAANLGGPVRRGMTQAAAAFGRIGAAIGEFLSEAATADTVTAIFATLESVFDDVATAIRPFLRGLRDLTDEILPSLSSQTRPITRAAEAFEDWAEAITESGEAAERFESAMGFLDHLANIAGVAARAIDVLGGAVGGFAATAQPFFDALGDALETLRDPLRSVGESLGRLLSALAPILEPAALLVGLVLDLAATILDILSPVIEGLISILSAILTPVLELAREYFDEWKGAMEVVAAWMRDTFLPFLEDELIPFFREKLGAAIQYIRDNWDRWRDAMVAVADYISERVWPVVRDELIPALSDLWDEVQKLYGAWTDLRDSLIDLALAIGEELMPELGDAEGATRLLDLVVGLLIAQIRSMIFIVKLITSTLRPWVEALRAVAGAIDRVTDNIGIVRDGIEGLVGDFSRIFQQGGRVLSIFNDIAGAARDVAGAIGSIPSLPSGLSGLSGLLPFASGGIVTRPTGALIGEAGPEVVIPLTRPQRAAELAERSGLSAMLGIGAGAGAASEAAAPAIGEVHMHMASNNADPEQVARRAVRQLRREIDGQGLERLERRRR